jgi:hypothetical protein
MQWGCTNQPKDPALLIPSVKLEVQRFDSAFFGMDTLQIQKSIQTLYKQYPVYAPVFFDKIIMLDPNKEQKSISTFYKAYFPIFKEVQKVNAPQKVQTDLEQAFTRFHYYFPEYKLPSRVIYFIGPLESYSNILIDSAVCVGLQMHLGASASWYYSEQIQTIYPPYISRRFEPQNITVATIQNLLEDFSPTKTVGKNLLTQMIEVGKKQFVLEQILPKLADTTIWGYAKTQLNALSSQESQIWDYLLQQKMLYSVAAIDSRDIMQTATSNSLFGEEIPGDVGRYMGYKIVLQWWRKNGATSSLLKLLSIPAEELFSEASYKP